MFYNISLVDFSVDDLSILTVCHASQRFLLFLSLYLPSLPRLLLIMKHLIYFPTAIITANLKYVFLSSACLCFKRQFFPDYLDLSYRILRLDMLTALHRYSKVVYDIQSLFICRTFLNDCKATFISLRMAYHDTVAKTS